jgi:hypothetical protein
MPWYHLTVVSQVTIAVMQKLIYRVQTVTINFGKVYGLLLIVVVHELLLTRCLTINFVNSILLVSKMSKASAQIYRYLNVQYMHHY